MFIQVNDPSLNRNLDEYQLPHLWDHILHIQLFNSSNNQASPPLLGLPHVGVPSHTPISYHTPPHTPYYPYTPIPLFQWCQLW